MDHRNAARISGWIALVAVGLAVPAAVGLLRLFAPIALDAPDAPKWVGPGLTFAACAVAGVATLLLLVTGLRSGSLTPLVSSAATGSLAVGLAVSGIRGLSDPVALGRDGVVPAMAAAAALLLVGTFVGQLRVLPGMPRVGAVLAVFGLVEGTAAAAALAMPGISDAALPLLVAAATLAVMAAAAGVERPGLGQLPLAAVLLAGSTVGLALARPSAIEVLLPILGIVATSAAAAWPMVPAEIVREDTVDGREAEGQPFAAVPLSDGRDAPAMAGEMSPGADREEVVRLSRELRGTIEELMHAHRTIELQREEIARASAVDPLTGVASRRAILERLHVEAASARRYRHPVAIVLLDIDGFAELNRTHGLAIGDAVLRELALRLRLRTRAADALGRAGGDSFLAILPHTDERGATVFADALRRRIIGRPVATPAGELPLSISTGVAIMRPGMSLTDDELLSIADEALASAKAAGGNRIAFDRLHGLARLDERRRDGGSRQPPGPDARGLREG